MDATFTTEMHSWAALESDESSAIVDPYSLDYDAESERDRWYEERQREARQLREDAEEAIWYAEQMNGEPITDEVREAAIQNLITAHYDARNAGDENHSVADLGLTGSLQALYTSLPNAGSSVFGPVSGTRHVPQKRPRSSRRRRSTRTHKSRSPGRSGDADPHLRRSLTIHRSTGRMVAFLRLRFRGHRRLELWAHLAAELRSIQPFAGAFAMERRA